MSQQDKHSPDSRYLTGQVAIVTGGGRGLGRAYAQALAQAGASVGVTARSEHEIVETAQLIEQDGGRALAIPADVTDANAVAHVVAEVERRLGPVDLLVNNAGVLRAIGSIAEIDEDVWWREIEINLRGPFLCTKAVLPGMIARGRGRIINIASGAGLGPISQASAYAISKTALIRFAESLAAETAEHGIAVFAIAPGTVRTLMVDYVMTDESAGKRAPFLQQLFRDMDAQGQLAPIERSVELVLSLAAGNADALSGCFLDIDYDLDELVRRAEEIRRSEFYTLRLRQ